MTEVETSESQTATERDRRLSDLLARLAIALSPWTLPICLFLGLLGLTGFWGVNILDGGLIPALSHRILLGEVPHADFISPMPVGASVLHLVDYALPLPLVLSTKVVTIAEFVAYGVFFSLFVFRTRLGNLSLAESAGVVVAVLVGLHRFPVISFYTIDGLVLTSGGFLLIQRGLEPVRISRLALAFGLLGVATTTKQSFWFAPFVAFAWVACHLVLRKTAIRQFTVVTTVAIVTCSLAPAAYVIWVSIGGGFHEMWAEITGTSRVYGTDLLTQFRDPHQRSELLPSLVVVVACISFVRLFPRRLPGIVDLVLRVVPSLLMLRLTLQERLAFNGEWSQRLFWCVIGAWIIRSVADRRLDPIGAMVALSCWMVTLSYGSPTPALASGAAVVYVADVVWRGAPQTFGRRSHLVYTAGAIAAAAVVVGFSIHVRTHDDYGVLRGGETFTLGGPVAGVAMDVTTYTYLSQAKECLRRYPAKWQAVLPEGALADAIYNLRNPFPLDWFWPPDYADAGGRNRLIAAAAKTDARGDYLLLFQTNDYGGPNLPGQIKSFSYDPALGPAITSRLVHAQRSQCGNFIAFYDPRT